jgi:hypothetical protein
MTMAISPFDGFYQVMVSFVNTVKDDKTSSSLTGVGQGLLMSIMAMLLVYQTLKTLLEGSSGRQIMAQVLHLVMTGSLAMFLLQDPLNVKHRLIDSADIIASKVSGAPMNDGFQQLTGALAPMFDGVIAILASEAPKPSSGRGAEENGASNGISSTGVWALMKSGPSGIGLFVMSWALKLVTCFALIVAALIATGQFMISQVLIHIAFLLAPLFIPFMIWEQGSFMFNGWLRFFVKAAFHKVVGLIVLALMANTIVKSTEIIQGLGIGNVEDGQMVRYTSLLALMLIAAIIAYLMGQIGSIADGLVSGSASAGWKPRVSAPKMGQTGKAPEKSMSTTSTATSYGVDGKIAAITKTSDASGPEGATKTSVTTDAGGNVTRATESVSRAFNSRKSK